MLKIGRKYNIGYDTIVAGKDQRRKMPLWHHVGVLDNHLWNKKLAVRATRAEIPQFELYYRMGYNSPPGDSSEN